MAIVDEEYMAWITKPYRTRKMAVKMINGSDELQYGSVFNYYVEITRTHPNS